MDKARILVVDDDIPLSRVVAILLEKTGLYELKVENRPQQALASARQFQPHMVLLDVDMPGMDGGAVAAQIRGDTSLRDLHIIFFTSLLSPKEAGQGLVRRGGDLFLPKPIDAPALIRSIEAVLARPPAGAAA